MRAVAARSPVRATPGTDRRRRNLLRPEVPVEWLALGASLFFLVFCNSSFFAAVLATGVLEAPGGWITVAGIAVLLATLHLVALLLVLTERTAKPVLAILFLVTALAAHFMSKYTVYLDADMVGSILHTDHKESRELVSWSLLPPVIVLGVLPTLIVCSIRIRRRPLLRAFAVRTAWIAGTATIALTATLFSFQGVSSLMRNHPEMRHLATPGNYLVSLVRVMRSDHIAKGAPRKPIGVDARVDPRPPSARPRLLVLVVGETVRAQNWGLNGYARQTTPRLAGIAPVNFPNMRSCGTATEVSLPCMFSPRGKAGYDRETLKRSESMMHLLARAGVSTSWLDNQTGCKGVCDGLEFESLEHATDATRCDSEGCSDRILLDRLPDVVSRHAGDLVVVLHPLGNHGPSYYKRYPQHLRRFVPACESPDLDRCDREQIVNAYDNAILATDELLADTIAFLRTQSERDSALVYVSDHGESLGESGLYLHGIPYAIAPDTQTRVPMVMWFSSGLLDALRLDVDCMKHESSRTAASHDNLFHTVLGVFGVSASEYDPDLDLLRSCIEPAPRTATH